jgi:hypothetical protein
MKISLLVPLFLILLRPSPAPAQAQDPSAGLSPYERQVYGDRLWQIPREPYQREYRSEEYRARPYLPPVEVPQAGASRPKERISGRSPLRTGPPAGLGRPSRTQQRFQSRKSFENEQRKISERSRTRAPGAAGPQPWQRDRQ